MKPIEKPKYPLSMLGVCLVLSLPVPATGNDRRDGTVVSLPTAPFRSPTTCTDYRPNYSRYHTIVHLETTEPLGTQHRNGRSVTLYGADASGVDPVSGEPRRLGVRMNFAGYFFGDEVADLTEPGVLHDRAGEPGTRITFAGDPSHPFSPAPGIRVWNGAIDIDFHCGVVIQAQGDSGDHPTVTLSDPPPQTSPADADGAGPRASAQGTAAAPETPANEATPPGASSGLRLANRPEAPQAITRPTATPEDTDRDAAASASPPASLRLAAEPGRRVNGKPMSASPPETAPGDRPADAPSAEMQDTDAVQPTDDPRGDTTVAERMAVVTRDDPETDTTPPPADSTTSERVPATARDDTRTDDTDGSTITDPQTPDPAPASDNGQEATPPAEPVQAWYRVRRVRADDVLNIREQAHWRSAKVGEIPPKASCVGWLGDSQMLGKNRWVRVRHEQTEGWVNAYYLRPNPDCRAADGAGGDG